jgi:hypothetical protein
LVLLPPVAYAGVYGATGWPMFTMLNSDVPGVVRWAAALLTVGLCVAVTSIVASTLAKRATFAYAMVGVLVKWRWSSLA